MQAGNKSVDFRVDLGLRSDGRAAGHLLLKWPKPAPGVATPRWLRFLKDRGDIEVIRSGGILRQVKTPQVLADIQAVNSYKYTIKLYAPPDWGTKSGGYWVPTLNAQYLTWVVENPDASPSVSNRLRISKLLGTSTSAELAYEYVWNESTQTLDLTTLDSQNTALRLETRANSTDLNGNLVQSYQISEGGSVIYETVETYLAGVYGKLIRSEVGPAGNPSIVTREYYTNPSETGRYLKLKSFTNADGSWEMRDYDSQGRTTIRIRSWQDVQMPSTLDASAAHTIQYNYTPVSGTPDDGSLYPKKARVATESILGTVVSKTYHVYYTDTGDEVAIEERCAEVSNSYGASANLWTTTRYTPAGANQFPPRRIKSIEWPDGRKDTYSWEQGTYTASNPVGQPGSFSASSSGEDVRKSITHGTTSSPAGIANQSTRTVTITDSAGLTLERHTYVYDGSAYALVDWTVQVNDERGRFTGAYSSRGAHASVTWGCCNQTASTDPTGIETTYVHDALGRLASATRTGVSSSGSYPAQASITTNYVASANSNGQIWTKTVTGNGGPSLVTSTHYDTAGRVIKTVDAAGLETLTAYAQGQNGGRTVTITPPGTGTEIRSHYLDGTLKSTTGTGVVHSYVSRGISSGQRRTTVYTGPALNQSPNWHRTTLDAMGRTVQDERPGYNSSSVVTTYTYYTDNSGSHAKGLLGKTTTTGQADTVYEYDALRRVSRSGLDVGGNGTLDLASTDRVTDTAATYYFDSSNWWSRRVTKVYATDNDDTSTTVSQVLELLTGFATGEISRTKTVDANGNETVTSVTIDRGTGDSLRLQTTTVNVPDSTTDEVMVVRNGLLQSTTSRTGLTTSFAYDALGRRTGITDARGNTTTTAYNSLGQMESTTDEASNTTAYAYYGSASSMAGRLKSVADPATKKQYFEYNARGQQTRTWGETTYPVEYGYDDYGLRTTMKTFRGGSGWDADTWPGSPGDADVTTWVYEGATGLLVEKQYQGHTTQDPRNIEYTYTSAGKLLTRKWSRSGGSGRIVTTYGYDSNTGDMTGISYNDGVTPPVTFEHDRLGRQATITDAVGKREFTYRDGATGDLQLDTEDIGTETGDLYSKLITRNYQAATSSTEMPGRGAGFQIGTSLDPDADYEARYSYYANGRLYGVVKGPGLNTGGATYAYAGGLVSKISFKDTLTTKVSANFTYENDRDLIQSMENIRDADDPDTTISKYAYVNDAVGRRTSVVHTGSAFSVEHLWLWGYNTRSELTTAERDEGTDPQDPADIMDPGYWTYAYDPIGNRLSHSVGPYGTVNRSYCANELNQYTHTHDGTDSCPDPTSPTEAFEHDADGNLVEDGTFVYTWDGENRLIAVAPASSPVNGDRKLEFQYDYMSRRVEKKVYTYSSGWGSPTEVLRFVYDRWNAILVLDGLDNNAVLKKYTWGLDLSGQRGDPSVEGIHGAGGIGGLLAVEETTGTHSGSYWFLYDANGNVGQMVKNTTNYPLAAHYEYDAYGNALGTPTGYAAANPFRFSTKWSDGETGLVYWGERYRQERWLNRDPIEEKGGSNLYVYLTNSPINDIDPVGLIGGSSTPGCRYVCGQCYNDCRKSKSQSACEKQWNACHTSCENTGTPGGGCGGGGGGGGGGPSLGDCAPRCTKAGITVAAGCIAATAATPIPGDEVVAVGAATCAACIAGTVTLATYIIYRIITDDPPRLPDAYSCHCYCDIRGKKTYRGYIRMTLCYGTTGCGCGSGPPN